MQDIFTIIFDSQSKIEQEIILMKDRKGHFLMTKDDIVFGLNNGSLFISEDYLNNPYIMKKTNNGDIKNVAIIRYSRVKTNERLENKNFSLKNTI